MNYIRVGEIVNTHGIKGEVRLISDFKYKKDVFKNNMAVYIGRLKDKQIINTYRVHKNYDMLTFVGINDINDVIMYKSDDVYINKSDLKIDAILDEDLIGLKVYDNSNYIGKVDSIMKNKANDILVIINDEKRNLIPNIKEFIKNVDLSNGKIEINNIEGLINED